MLGCEEYRAWGPCVSEARWADLFASNGFSGADLVFRDNDHEEGHEMSMIITTAVEHTVSDPPYASLIRTAIVSDPTSSAQKDLATRLKRYLEDRGCPECSLIQYPQLLTPDLSEGAFYISLLDLEIPILHDLKECDYSGLKSFLLSTDNLLWITGGGGSVEAVSPEFGAINGLFRVLQTENCNKKLVTLAVDRTKGALPQTLENIHRVLVEAIQISSIDSIEHEYVENGGILEIPRLVEAKGLKMAIADLQEQEKLSRQAIEDRDLILKVTSPGTLNPLTFVENDAVPTSLQEFEIEVEVLTAGIALADFFTSFGRLNQNWLGSECAGVITKCGEQSGFNIGDSVLVYGTGLTRTRVLVHSKWAVKMPQGMSYSEAASFPAAYSLAYYALVDVGRIKAGDSVLIHCASGAVGQGAIQIANNFGARVFVTVGSQEKKQLLKDLYDLGDQNIFNSRDSSFADKIMNVTNHRGVDIVLDPFLDERCEASWECLRPLGRFLDISQVDQSGPKFPQTGLSNKNISYSKIDIASMLTVEPGPIQEAFGRISDLISEGVLRPPSPINVFPASNVDDAFRSLQSGEQMGKKVLSFVKTDVVHVSFQSSAPVESV